MLWLVYMLYEPMVTKIEYIRPQGVENRASRPLSCTQATRREVSSWVGDYQRIPSVVCIFPFLFGSIRVSI